MQASAEPLPSRAGVSPVPPAMSPDVDRLTRDFRQLISDFETLLKNAQMLSTEGAAVARAELTRSREPLKAVLVAAAVGAIVALVVARR